VVRNAVDINEFSPGQTNGKSLLYIGRFVHNNGIQDLLAALPLILDSHSDAEVHLVGSGPLEEDVQKSIQSSGLSGSVTTYDYVDDISEMYDLASVFCRPSYSEGLPLTMLEAMASGVPPVVTGISGVPEVVTDHETGVLLEPGNPDEVAQAVIELFDDTDLRKRLSKNARKYMTENLTWEQRTERIMEVYSQVLTND
jgi:glycosyltransferase involved in cell wall biosynthesis